MLLKDGLARLQTDAITGESAVLSQSKRNRHVFERKVGDTRHSRLWPSARPAWEIRDF